MIAGRAQLHPKDQERGWSLRVQKVSTLTKAQRRFISHSGAIGLKEPCMLKLNPLGAAAAIAVSGLLNATSVHAMPAGDLGGVWRNPKNTVHVEVRPCGESVCGYVVWASEKARRDAREGGTPELVGTQLFRDFSPGKNGVWRGRVFVPDLGKVFSGSAERVGERALKARGCLFASVLCKSQVWVRVES